MAKPASIETKALYDEAIRQNTAKKDWQKLSEVMIGAEMVGVNKALRKKGWLHVGQFETERGNHPAAIIALNSARVLERHPGKVLALMFAEIEAFCEDFDGRFSRQDLLLLAQALERVRSFHSIHSKVPADVQDKGKRVMHWIESRLSDAPLKVETPATHHVQRIYSALYSPMTIEEVRAEFARIVEPLIRERLERKTVAASGGGGKDPNDPKSGENDATEPPEKQPKTPKGLKGKSKRKRKPKK